MRAGTYIVGEISAVLDTIADRRRDSEHMRSADPIAARFPRSRRVQRPRSKTWLTQSFGLRHPRLCQPGPARCSPMGIAYLTSHFAGMSATGVGALLAAWLVWRIWRRLLRTVITCMVVALVVYFAFPGVAHRVMGDQPASATTGGQQ